MLTSDELWDIQNKAIEDYLASIKDDRYSDETLYGDIPVWRDADDYYLIPGECTVSESTLKEWIQDNFDTAVAQFLHIEGNTECFEDIASDEDKVDAATFYDFVFEKCKEVEDFFWESPIYEELCDAYFEDNRHEQGPDDSYYDSYEEDWRENHERWGY